MKEINLPGRGQFKNELLIAKRNGYVLHVGWSQAWHTKLSITHSCFELQTPDFSWKFVWIFGTNYKSKKFIASKLAITRPILKL